MILGTIAIFYLSERKETILTYIYISSPVNNNIYEYDCVFRKINVVEDFLKVSETNQNLVIKIFRYF